MGKATPVAGEVEVVTVLLRALELRDPWTHAHSLRVSTLSNLIAQVMGFAAEEVEHIGHAALLHDVGKLGVPDAVLFKAGSLTDSEVAEIQRHPGLGFQVLDRLQSLPPAVAMMVLYHHERWDGSGYPEGLRGEKIPLGSQIIGIAEAFDCITNDTVFRPAFTLAEARERLLATPGRQFSPELVATFCNLPLLRAARHARDASAGPG